MASDIGFSERQRKQAREWLGVVAAVLAVLGVTAYVMIYIAYSIFYGPLGVSPQEVGLGYKESLNAAGVGLFLFTIFFGIVGVGLIRWTGLTGRSVIIGVASLVLLAILSPGIIHSARRSQDVEEGRRVEAIRLFKIVPMIPIKAEPVQIVWAGNPPRNESDVPTACLMYLGNASSVDIFFDPKKDRIVRIPTSSAVILAKPKGQHCL